MKIFPAHTTLDDKIQLVIVQVLRLSLVLALPWSVVVGSWDLLIASTLALLFSFIPNRIEDNYRIKLPVEFELLAVVFIYAALIGGFAFDGYARIWWWDDLLHISSGVVLGLAGFVILYALYYQGKLQASAGFIAFLIVAFAVTLGVVWEIFEFLADLWFGASMQPSLNDTMLDLIVDMAGALVIAVPAYFYIKRDSAGWVAKLVKNFLKHNPQIKRRLSRRH